MKTAHVEHRVVPSEPSPANTGMDKRAPMLAACADVVDVCGDEARIECTAAASSLAAVGDGGGDHVCCPGDVDTRCYCETVRMTCRRRSWETCGRLTIPSLS